MTDQLTEINRADLPLLRDLYKTSDGAKSSIAFVTIKTYIHWFQQDSAINDIKFYCLNGDFSRGTFVVVDRAIAHADTLNESTDELLRLLVLLDYSKGYFFVSLNDRVAPIVHEALKQKSVEILISDWNLNFYLPKEKGLAFNIQPPEGIELKPLTKRSDIEKAYSAWPVGCRSSIHLLDRVAKYNPSVGAFTKDGTLVAWVFRLPTGLLLALQTDEHHYGRGYGSLVAKALSKQIAEIGDDIYAGVFEVNTPSRALFKRIGFNVIGKFNWICTKLNWSDDE